MTLFISYIIICALSFLPAKKEILASAFADKISETRIFYGMLKIKKFFNAMTKPLFFKVEKILSNVLMLYIIIDISHIFSFKLSNFSSHREYLSSLPQWKLNAILQTC